MQQNHELLRLKSLPRLFAGVAANVVASFFLIRSWPDFSIVVVSLYFIFACTIDTLHSKIPNLLNASLASAGLAFNFFQAGWIGAGFALCGLLLGVGLLLIPWLMGGFGGGDVKALGALGTMLGPQALLHTFVYMALFGGAMALLHYLCEHNLKAKFSALTISIKAMFLSGSPGMLKPTKTQPLRFPYAAAIALGYYTYLSFGPVL